MASVRGKYQEAIGLFTQELREDPITVDAYLFRGVAYFNLQRPALARRFMRGSEAAV
jgi:hypothetical protein